MLVIPRTKTLIAEMPKTGTTWMRRNLTNWQEAVPIDRASPRHDAPSCYVEGREDDWLKLFVFREPVQWCMSAFEYYSWCMNTDRVTQKVVDQYDHTYFSYFPFEDWTHQQWWEFLAERPGHLTEYFSLYLDWADQVIPLCHVRQALHSLWKQDKVCALNEVHLLRSPKENKSAGVWKRHTGLDALINQVREQEATLFERYQDAVREYKVAYSC